MASETLIQKARTMFESAESEFSIGNEVQGRRNLRGLASLITREIGDLDSPIDGTEQQKDEKQEKSELDLFQVIAEAEKILSEARAAYTVGQLERAKDGLVGLSGMLIRELDQPDAADAADS